jgi:uncharacterized coiled-coil DUF342 family protein
MATRDKYVRKLKSQIDKMNKQAAQLETRAKTAQAEYTKQVKQYRKRRDAALTEIKRLRGASSGAWRSIAKGAGSALKSMRSAVGKARAQFSRKK